MGYKIIIGEAKLETSTEYFPEMYVRWTAEYATSDDAPVFDNDPTGNSNMRSPSYSGWRDCIDSAGLTHLFYNGGEGLMDKHPGCRGITRSDVDVVKDAVAAYRAKVPLPAGFSPDPMPFIEKYRTPPTCDGNLARLLWLAFWMDWAVKNCKLPVIANS